MRYGLLIPLLVLGCRTASPATSATVPAVSHSGPAARDLATRAESLATRFAGNRANRALLDSAIAAADSALRMDSSLISAYAARGIAFAAAGRPRDAAAAYRQVLAMNPDYPRAANAAIGQFWRAGQYHEAYRWGKRQAEREPTNLSVLFNYQVAAAFLIERARAESLMVRALEIDPRFAVAHGELAFLAMYGGRLDQAVAHMEAALAIDTTSALNRGGLAQMLVPFGYGARARDLLAPIVARDSTATAYGGRSALAIYGWALRASGDPLGAQQAFERALARLNRRRAAGESSYQLYREMAAIHALQGNRAEAIASLESAADAGMHTYASWDLDDPMFASLRNDPAVRRIVERMRESTRRMRRLAGLDAG